MIARSLSAIALMIALAACAGSDTLSRSLPPGFVSDAPQIVASTDWTAPEEVRVTISGHAFQPNALTFHRDRATRLILVNDTESEHGIAAKQFFADIAVESVRGGGVTEKAPWIEELIVAAGQTKELWFVPARFGAYSFECPSLGHPSLGERGTINVIR
jgi:uncharacterized cupredoxin-like copper-binding protein